MPQTNKNDFVAEALNSILVHIFPTGHKSGLKDISSKYFNLQRFLKNFKIQKGKGSQDIASI